MIKHFVGTNTNTAGDYYFTFINEYLAFNIVNDERFPKNIGIILFEFLWKFETGFFLSNVLSKQTCQYDWVTLIGNFKLTVTNMERGMIMSIFNIESLISKPTCFQSAN